MTKTEFLRALWTRLSTLPKEDVELALDYYNDKIKENMANGMSEAEAVAAVGSVDEAAERVRTSLPNKEAKINTDSKSSFAQYTTAYSSPTYDYTPKKSSGGWKAALLILGFPIWFPLLITACSLIFSAFVVVWSLTIAFFAVAGSFIAAGVGGVVMMFVMMFQGKIAAGLFFLGSGFLLAGLAILLFLISGKVVAGTARVSRGMWHGITSMFGKRRAE